MKYSVCIDSIFQDMTSEDALEEVKAAGFTDFEFWAWWNRDIKNLKEKADSLSLHCSALCTRFISLTDPSKRNEYLAGLQETLEAAKFMEAEFIISQVGNDTGESRNLQHDSMIDGLKKASPLLEGTGITLVIEPLNIRVDHAGYYLVSSDEGFEIIDAVGSKSVKLLFDIYHQQISEGDVLRRIENQIDKIGHFHAAGNPGRNELDKGELNYPHIFGAIDKMNYQNYMGLEYFPLENPTDGLKRLKTFCSQNLSTAKILLPLKKFTAAPRQN